MDNLDKSAETLASEANQVGRDAAAKAKGLAADAVKSAKDASASGKAYVEDALDAASEKLDHVKSQVTETADYLAKVINDEPVKAVLVTAVVSSLITALFLTALRDRD